MDENNSYDRPSTVRSPGQGEEVRLTALGHMLDSGQVAGRVRAMAAYPAGVTVGTEPLNLKSLTLQLSMMGGGAAQGDLTEPRSHTSKNCFIDTARLGSAARSSGPVENTWELWLFWPRSSCDHSRGNQKS